MASSTGGSSTRGTAALILAAGAATRMGRLKQLLPFRGTTLLEHAIQQARDAEFSPIIVVAGAEGESIRATAAARPVEFVQNDSWQSGMGTSIAAGVRHLETNWPDAPAVAILLVDQPYVTGAHLVAMSHLLRTGSSPIVAAQYGGTLGVPALFVRSIFPLLLALPPEAGARHLLRDSGLPITAFALPEAAIDIDTPADFAALTSEAGLQT